MIAASLPAGSSFRGRSLERGEIAVLRGDGVSVRVEARVAHLGGQRLGLLPGGVVFAVFRLFVPLGRGDIGFIRKVAL